jgi:hypothetical protein
VNRGVLLLEAGSLEAARQAFLDALAIEPLCAQALYNLGWVQLSIYGAKLLYCLMPSLSVMLALVQQMNCFAHTPNTVFL